MENKWHWHLFIVVALIFIVSAGTLAYFYFFPEQKLLRDTYSYTIPNVPYIGIYNHVGAYKALGSNAAAAAATILEYWDPGSENLENLQHNLPSPTLTFTATTLADLANYFESHQPKYLTISGKLSQSELKTYLSKTKRTPLLVALPLSASQPANIVNFPFSVLIGIDEVKRKFVLHDYWFGPIHEISFDEFTARQALLPLDIRDRYLVIQPKDGALLQRVVSRPQIAYAPRSDFIIKNEPLMRDFAMAAGATLGGNMAAQEKYLQTVVHSPLFVEYFPPSLKVTALARLSDALLRGGKVQEALQSAKQAISENHDLDKSFKDWPGYEVLSNNPGEQGRLSWPYRILGDALFENGDRAGAIEAYKTALTIDGGDERTRAALSRLSK